MTWRRVHDHPRGLVDDDQVGILVDDLKRDRLRLGRKLQSFGFVVLEQVTLAHGFRGSRLPAVDGDQARAGEPTGCGPAEVRVQSGQDAIEAPRLSGYPDRCPPFCRRTYPMSSSTTPTEMAESATFKTGQKW